MNKVNVFYILEMLKTQTSRKWLQVQCIGFF